MNAANGCYEALGAALANGWTYIPCREDKTPLLPWKAFQYNKPTPEELDRWNRRSDVACWALICGSNSGVVALDFDGPEGRATCERLGLDPHVKTGSGGFHVYVEHPGFPVRTVNGKSLAELGRQFPGLDIRADGGYAIFTGRNVNGPYKRLRDLQPEPWSALPDALREFIEGNLRVDNTPTEPATDPARPEASTERTESAATERQPSGSELAHVLLDRAINRAPLGRNDAGYWLACQLRDNGFNETDAEAIMRAYQRSVGPLNAKGQNEPYTEAEALRTLRSAYSAARREPWATPGGKSGGRREPLPDAAPSVEMAVSLEDVTIEDLNRNPLFRGRIRFESFCRRGPKIYGRIGNGREVCWPSNADLLSFSKSQAVLMDASVVIGSPPRGEQKRIWESIVRIILQLADADRIDTGDAAKSEYEDLLEYTFNSSGRPEAKTSEEMAVHMLQLERYRRNPAIDSMAPPCVFLAEGYAWVYIPVWRAWLSTPAGFNRLFPVQDLRNGLAALDFETRPDVKRRVNGQVAKLDLWRGPVVRGLGKSNENQ